MKVVKTVWQAKASSVPRHETVVALLLVLGESTAGRGLPDNTQTDPLYLLLVYFFPRCVTFKDFSDIKKKTS